VHRLTAAILDAYVAHGASGGPLSVPVTDVYTWDGAQRVDFARGAIVVRGGVAQVIAG